MKLGQTLTNCWINEDGEEPTETAAKLNLQRDLGLNLHTAKLKLVLITSGNNWTYEKKNIKEAEVD